MAQRPLRPADAALLNRAFLGLLQWAAQTADGPGGGPADAGQEDGR
jgi:molecular chaperone HtpG